MVVTNYPYEVTRPHRVYHALVFFLLAIGLTLFTDLRLALALLTGAVGMILSGVITIDEAYRSVGWQSVFLLAGLLPLGLAVETTGTAAWIAQETLRLLGDVPLWVLQGALAVLTTGFTLLMSNVGATVLLVPLAINIALGAGGNPAVFALTVALAASNSFLIPTHQVNALIMGAGRVPGRGLHARGRHHDHSVPGDPHPDGQSGLLMGAGAPAGADTGRPMRANEYWWACGCSGGRSGGTRIRSGGAMSCCSSC